MKKLSELIGANLDRVRMKCNLVLAAILVCLLTTTGAVAQRTTPPPVGAAKLDTTKTPSKTKDYTGRGSQILNDSARNVYGPTTSMWISERQIFYNDTVFHSLDTTINDFHRWTYVQRFNNFYHDLGNVGTALNPVFPMISPIIGANSGFTAYQPYLDTQEPRYFDTKSPYTRFNLVWGGDGRAMTEVEFSRNINPRWNFGFNYRPILADKQISRRRKGDRQSISHYYDFHTNYRSKNKRYWALANYRRIRHRVNENGGIFLAANARFESYFDANATPYLSATQTEDWKSTLHVFHQYQLAKPFQVYQTLDVTKQKNGFISGTELNNFFDTKIITPGLDSVNSANSNFFRTFQSEIGIKGNAAFLFYNAYFKLRSFENFNRPLLGYQLPFNWRGTESYVGGRIALRYDSLNELSGAAEYLLDGNYRIQANLRSRWLDAELISSLSKPGFVQQGYRGAHDFWINDFTDVFSNQVTAFAKYNSKRFTISPGLQLTSLSNYVFFKQNNNAMPRTQSVLPMQSSGTQQWASPQLKATARFFRHFYFRPHLIYSRMLRNDDDAVQIPEFFVNAQLAYENTLANGNLQAQIGVDFHWRSEYYTMNYDPAIQQFFVQNTFMNPSYMLADIFFAGKLKRGRFFFRYHNFTSLFLDGGYLPTPGYRGVGNILDFGFDLFLFD